MGGASSPTPALFPCERDPSLPCVSTRYGRGSFAVTAQLLLNFSFSLEIKICSTYKISHFIGRGNEFQRFNDRVRVRAPAGGGADTGV